MSSTNASNGETEGQPRPSLMASVGDLVRDGLLATLKLLASLRLTVVLLAMAVFIVFAATLAQIDKGVWVVVDQYFRSTVAWIRLGIFFPSSWDVPTNRGFFFPSGWMIGAALLTNLFAAHAVRFTVKAQGKRLFGGLLVLVAGGVLTYFVLAGYLTHDLVLGTSVASFWRVLWRLFQGVAVAGMLYWACHLLFTRRAGIVLLHTGVILLMVSQFFTGMFAVESRMTIKEGETVSFVDRSRETELAVIGQDGSETDRVVTVPDSVLRRGGRIQHESLPFDVKLVEYMANSRQPIPMSRVGGPMKAKNRATAGAGKQFLILERPPGGGPQSSQNYPSAYVEFFKEGTDESLGVYIVSYWFYPNATNRQIDVPQYLEVDGQRYRVELRPEREYIRTTADATQKEALRFHLKDFVHETYGGTNTPKTYASHIRLIDPARNIERDVKISMNNPLRYQGRTFYQSAFLPDNSGTILQVVENAGWLIPYIACVIVATGLVAQFGGHLKRFIRRMS